MAAREQKSFEEINRGYAHAFKSGRLSLGVVVPIENYANGTVPSMHSHLKRVQLVESLGFKAIWVRDVPLHVPSFGDAGQTYDPFTYLGYLAGQTTEIALGVASIALPLHHPLHMIKSAATIDQLSDGRLLLGIASGDRPSEYPSMGFDYDNRGEKFREAYRYMRKAQESFPLLDSSYGALDGKADVLPKATAHKIPMLITGHSQQDTRWVAEHGDGWMYYPRNLYMQSYNVSEWRDIVLSTSEYDKPFMQPLYVDLHANADHKPEYIHLGFRLGVHYLQELLMKLQHIGVNHVAINLRFSVRRVETVLEEIAKEILPNFHTETDRTKTT